MKHPHTQLENETLEALARASLTVREFRVCLAVLRLTNGYHLAENTVSLQYLQLLTGLPRNHLQATIKRLSQAQVLALDDGKIACHGPALWRLPSASPDLGLAELGPPQIAPASPKVGLASRLGTSSASPRARNKTCPLLPLNNPRNPRKENVIKKTCHLSSGGGESPPGRETPRKKEKVPGDPRVRETALALEKERGYKSPNYGGEVKAIKWMLGQGHSPEDILACWRAMKRDPWWASRELLLMSVQKEIGQWVKTGRQPDAFEKKGGYGKVRGYIGQRLPLGTREEHAAQAERFGSTYWGDPGPGNGSGVEGADHQGQRPAPGDQGDPSP